MPKLLPWVQMPSKWILNGGLREFRWGAGFGSGNAAALMALAPILHFADRATGIAHMTYDRLEIATTLSRTKIAEAIRILEAKKIISRTEQRSVFVVEDFNPAFGWAKFPSRDLYSGGQIEFFGHLHLRKKSELDALKLWYFFAARRDNDVNLAKVTYDQISEHTGIPRERIRAGVSLLAANTMVHVEHIPSRHSEYGVANAYRLPQIESRRHMGTVGRGLTEFDDLS